MVSIRNKYGGDGASERKHSAAMSYEQMQTMMGWSEKECPIPASGTTPKSFAEREHQVKHLMFRAFACIGWVVWTRWVIIFYS